jgi:hypothetical protein
MFNDKSPEPTPLMRPLPRATEVPLAALGPLIAPITAITTLTQAPTALALQGVMNVISIVAQSHADAETLFGKAPLSLFAFSVAESSARKSSVDGLAMEAIRAFEKPLLAKYAKKLALFEERQISKDWGRSGRGVIDDESTALVDVQCTQPISPKISFDDMTYEGLVRHLEFGQPSIGLSSDEGGKIVGGYSMSAQNQLAFAAALSNLWDGKDINKVRAGAGATNLVGRRMSLHLSIQPLVAQRLFTNDELRDQGILSRVLVVMPESLKGTRFLCEDEVSLRERQIAKEALGRFGERIVGLLEKRPAVSKDNPQELTPLTLQLEAAARMRLVDFYNLVEIQQSEGRIYANISGFAGKAAEQAARIAGNIALFEDPEAQLIRPEQMAIGITLMEFYLAEAVRIFDTGHVSQNLIDAEDLRIWLRDQYAGDFADVSEISKRGPRRLRSSEKIKVLMRILEEYGHLKQSGGVVVSINGRNSRKAYRIIRS